MICSRASNFRGFADAAGMSSKSYSSAEIPVLSVMTTVKPTAVKPTTVITSRRVGNRKMSRAEAVSVEIVSPVMILVVISSDHQASCVRRPISRVIGSETAVVGTFVRAAYVVITCASGQ